MEEMMRTFLALRRMLPLGIVLGCFMLPLNALSATLSGSVKDVFGKRVKDAVVYANPLSYKPAFAERPQNVAMDQIDKEFVPLVLPVQIGTAVHFSNKDDTPHHDYSISPAKKFELPLYKGIPVSPVVFDKPGPVVLGCKIHDWMVAYIYVVETPYFSKTGEDGSAEILNLPPGQYEVLVWHPRLSDQPESNGKRLSLSQKEKVKVDFVITMKQVWRTRPTPNVSY